MIKRPPIRSVRLSRRLSEYEAGICCIVYPVREYHVSLLSAFISQQQTLFRVIPHLMRDPEKISRESLDSRLRGNDIRLTQYQFLITPIITQKNGRRDPEGTGGDARCYERFWRGGGGKISLKILRPCLFTKLATLAFSSSSIPRPAS